MERLVQVLGVAIATSTMCFVGAVSRAQTIRIDPAPVPEAMVGERFARWHEIYLREMRPVRRDWSVVSRVLRAGRLDDLPQRCRRFGHTIGRIDRERLLEVPDPLLRFHLSRGLRQLDDAVTQCRKGRPFALSFYLSRARTTFQFIDRWQRR